MTLADFFAAVAKISLLLFVVTSMLAMGLSLTIPMILQPLKNVKLVVLALLANFVLVPLLAFLITLIIPLEQSLKIGLILFVCFMIVVASQTLWLKPLESYESITNCKEIRDSYLHPAMLLPSQPAI